MQSNTAASSKVPTEEHEDHDWLPRLDRRAAVRLLSLTAVAAAAGCGSTATNSTASGTTASSTGLSASTLAPAVSASVTLTASVSPAAATGSVVFYDGTTALGTGTLSMGTATLVTSFSTAGAHTLTASYAGSATYAASTSAAVSVAVTAASASACSATLEGEEGPYFVDDSASGYFRSNIVSNLDGTQTQTGIPLVLTVYVYDSKKSCAAMQSVQVDIWHCNASGVYSAESVESTVGQSWLRGYQITDANGMVQFSTIVPGWYAGRTQHIHMRFRSTYDQTSTSGSNTMQVFFDQTLIDTISTTISPYKAYGTDPTTNASDHVYAMEENGSTLLTMTGSTSAGYAATFKAYMPI